MSETIMNRAEATRWQQKYDGAAPRVGAIAPDFELRDSRGQHPIRLSEFRGEKPVALVFGSFT